MSAPDGRKVAVVLSGGGATGAYEVGVLKALLSGRSPTTDYQPLQPDIFTGTSIGGFNAAYLVSKWDSYGPAAIGDLERFWLEKLAGPVRSNGVYRLRGNPLELLAPSSYLPNPLPLFRRLLEDGVFLSWEAAQRTAHFLTSEGSLERRLVDLLDFTTFLSMEPLEANLRELDYATIRLSKRQLQVAATNWATGELRLFLNRDMTDSFGPLALRASAAVPGLFPPAEVGAHPYVDGSVLLNTPLSPAIHAGAEILHIIYLDPEVSNIPLARLRQTYTTLHRIFQIGWSAAYADDISDAARINRSLEAVERARQSLTLDEKGADILFEVAQLRRAAAEAPYKPLTIHRYHPQTPLEGELSMLNFERSRVEALIEAGFTDAVYHDRDDSEDVIPGAQPRPSRRRTARRRVVT